MPFGCKPAIEDEPLATPPGDPFRGQQTLLKQQGIILRPVMAGIVFKIDGPLKYPGAGQIPAVLFKIDGPGEVADNRGSGQTVADLSAHAEQATSAFYRNNIIVRHHEIHIAGSDKVDVVGNLMPPKFTGEGGKISISANLFKK